MVFERLMTSCRCFMKNIVLFIPTFNYTTTTKIREARLGQIIERSFSFHYFFCKILFYTIQHLYITIMFENEIYFYASDKFNANRLVNFPKICLYIYLKYFFHQYFCSRIFLNFKIDFTQLNFINLYNYYLIYFQI